MSSTVPHYMFLNSFILHSNHMGIDTVMIPVVHKKQKQLKTCLHQWFRAGVLLQNIWVGTLAALMTK